MTDRSMTPDFAALEVAMDVWSQPFWDAGAQHRTLMPQCTNCGTFRWPAGPFCPKCRTQPVDWVPPGTARIYSFTILPVRGAEGEAIGSRVPTLVTFDDAPDVRLVSVMIDTPIDRVAIGAPVEIDWIPAANAKVPVFRLRQS